MIHADLHKQLPTSTTCSSLSPIFLEVLMASLLSVLYSFFLAFEAKAANPAAQSEIRSVSESSLFI